MVDRRSEPLTRTITIVEVQDPEDADVLQFVDLMRSSFADPDLVLSAAQVQRMLAEGPEGGRRLHLLVAKQGTAVIGGTLFSYVPASQCGFSEYIIISPAFRGQGLARELFEARRAVLAADAAGCGHPEVYGLFVEVANPERVPPGLREAERRNGIDTERRWQIMHHFGFRRVDIPYTLPPTEPGKESVTYLDLLFCPMGAHASRDRLPVHRILTTLAPIWRAWAPGIYTTYLERLAAALGDGDVPLVPMLP